MKATLLTDITSHLGKPKTTYGHAKETVEIISDHGNVLIVEGKSGRFPVLRSDVQEWGKKI